MSLKVRQDRPCNLQEEVLAFLAESKTITRIAGPPRGWTPATETQFARELWQLGNPPPRCLPTLLPGVYPDG